MLSCSGAGRLMAMHGIGMAWQYHTVLAGHAARGEYFRFSTPTTRLLAAKVLPPSLLQ